MKQFVHNTYSFLILWLSLFLPNYLPAQNSPFIPPQEIIDQDWRIHSLLEEGKLEKHYLMFVEFDKDGAAWIASSNGLLKYDGYTWTRYSTESGLPSSFVRCVLINSKGLMWVGTDKGAGVFDGKSFQRMGSETGLSGQCIRRIREDSHGAIWFCGDSWPIMNDPGGLTVFQDGQWIQYTPKDGLPHKRILDFFEDSQGRKFALTMNGMAQWEGERWINPIQGLSLQNELFWSIVESPEYGVLASSSQAIYVLNNNQWTRYASQFPRDYKLCVTKDGKVFSCGELGQKNRYFLEWKGTQFQPVSAGFKSPAREISQMRESPDGSIWCIGFDFLKRWQRTGGEWTEYAHVPLPQAIDRQNRVWFADSKKTLRWDENRWESVENPHSNLIPDKNGNILGWSNKGFTLWAGESTIHYSTDETDLSTPFFGMRDATGDLYFFGINPQRQRSIVLYDGSNWVKRVLFKNTQQRVIGSANDPEKGVWFLLQDSARYELLYVDPNETKTLSIPIPLNLPFPALMRIDHDKNIWIYGSFGLYRSNLQSLENGELLSAYVNKNFTSCVASSNDIWFGITALMGNPGGLLQYANGHFTLHPANPQELGVVGKDNSIFFAGDDCIYQISDREKRAPRLLPVNAFGAIRNIVEGKDDTLWIGLADSALRYRKDNVPPDTQIIASASEVIAGRNLAVRFRGIERFSPDIPNNQFRFSWRIDSEPWTDFQSESEPDISLHKIPPGSHLLHVRSQDIGHHIDPTPAAFAFVIQPTPLQDRIWFKPLAWILSILIIMLVFYAFIAKNKLAYHAQKLEQLVAERTNSLQEREATLKSIFRSAPVGIGMVSNRIIGWTNERLCEMLGYASDEIIGKNGLLLYSSEEEFLRIGEEGYRGLEIQGTIALETQLKCKNGRVIDVLLNLTLIDPLNPSQGVIFTALDITERKQAAKTLAENERIFREAIEVAGAVPYYQNYLTQKYDYVGPGIQELIGYSPTEFTPQLWTLLEQEYIPLGKLRELTEEEAIQKARGEEGISWRADFRIRTRSGEECWLANSAVQVRDENNKVVGSLGIIQDITERKRLEEHLRQAQKMEAIGQLAGGIAHNINNLLTGIIGNQSLALVKATEEIRTYLTNSNNAAMRAAELVKELLAFSRKTSLELKPCNLNDAMQEVFHLIRETFDRRIEIELQTADSLPSVLADVSQIHSVLMNLCINARDAIEKKMGYSLSSDRTKESYRITLKTEILTIPEGFSNFLSNNRPGSYVRLSVTDNGTGIGEETKKHIFEPFFTTKDTVGTGLGLASAFGVIKQHNGWIDFTSQAGEGTTFQIDLPIIDKEIEKMETQPQSTLSLTGTETVLLADDEELILNLGQEILSDSGYTVLKAKDGQECLDLFHENKDRIAVTVLDLSMPKLSGVEVMKHIFAENPASKIIVSSGHANGFDSDNMTELGAAGIISKPYKPMDFLRKIREILDWEKTIG